MAHATSPHIPLYSPTGAHIGEILVSIAEADPHAYTIRRNRRQHATCATLRQAAQATEEALHRGWSSRHGRAFEQQIQSGHVWALRGVRGSGR